MIGLDFVDYLKRVTKTFRMMELQYILDENGKKVAVIIPIQDWYEITGEQKGSEDVSSELSGSDSSSKDSKSAGLSVV